MPAENFLIVDSMQVQDCLRTFACVICDAGTLSYSFITS